MDVSGSFTTIECYKGKSSGGYPKNDHKSISRVEQMKHTESKVRRYHKKFEADRQSSLPETTRERGSR